MTDSAIERAAKWNREHHQRRLEIQRRYRNSKRGKQTIRKHYDDHKEDYLSRSRAQRLSDPEAYKEYMAQYAKDNPEKFQAAASRRRSRAAIQMTDIDRELSAAYRLAIASDPCFYCGDPGEHNDHYQALAGDPPGTDHWWNLVRSCAACNISKHVMHGDDFLVLIGSL